VIMKWKDKNDIHLASATHYGEMVPTGIQDWDVSKPKIVIDYDSEMG
jgi:hypothetical protein